MRREMQGSGRRSGSEAVRCLTVLIAEGDHLVGLHAVDPGASLRTAAGVADLHELLAANLELPVLAVLGEPRIGQRPERRGVCHTLRRALDDNVLTAVPTVGTGYAGRHRHTRVGVQVALLLLR